MVTRTYSYLKVCCQSGLLQYICFCVCVCVFKILRTEMFEPAEFTCFSEERLCRREFLSCGAYRLCRIFCSVTLVYPQFIYVTESYVSQINEFQIIKVVLSLLVRIYYWPEECHNVFFPKHKEIIIMEFVFRFVYNLLMSCFLSCLKNKNTLWRRSPISGHNFILFFNYYSL